MFGFGKARAPLGTFQRVDIELLMRKTIETLGLPFVRRVDVVMDLEMLQLDSSSPDRLIASATERIYEYLPSMESDCKVLIVDASDAIAPSAYEPAGETSSALIQITNETVSDPLRTVMELAYQFSTHYWHTKPASSELDRHPRTAHLLPICCGLGVLASDACLYDDQWSQGGWTGWSISRSGYYSTVEIGYALALFARARKESDPFWAKSLRLDSMATAKQAWRYFADHSKNGRSLLFDAEAVPSTKADLTQLAKWMEGDDKTFALAAGFALEKLSDLSPRVIEATLVASRSGDPDLVPVTAKLLGKARKTAPEVERRVHEMVRKESPPTVLAALQSAESLGMSLDVYRPRLGKLLGVFSRDPIEVLELIGRQGQSCQFLGPKICDCIVVAIQETDEETFLIALDCLQRVDENPEAVLRKQIKSPEILEEVLKHLVLAK